MKEKYELYNYTYGEMDLDNHKLFMMMDDGAKFDVSLYELSDEDIEGLMTVEDYDMNEDVFERLMEVAEEREEQNFVNTKEKAMNEIKKLRAELGLTQKKFGEKFGIPIRTVQDWEYEKREPRSYIIYMMYRIIELEKS